MSAVLDLINHDSEVLCDSQSHWLSIEPLFKLAPASIDKLLPNYEGNAVAVLEQVLLVHFDRVK